MLQEYSVDPDGFNSVEQFQRIVEACGISDGRYIANLPMQRWDRIVYERLRAIDPDRAKRAEELIFQCKKRLGFFPSRISKCSRWMEATLEQHQSEPFIAVVTEKEDFPNRTSLDDLSVATDPWKAKRGDKIPIDAVSIANAAAPLLRISKEIRLVDPYFDPTRHRKTLLEIVKHSIKVGKKLDRFECHCKVRLDLKQNPTDTVDAWSHRFEENCRTQLPKLLPNGFHMTIFLWKEIPDKELMHARYVMTELGALKFDRGLDSIERDATTDVDWLTPEVHQFRWAAFDSNSTTYKRIRTIEIVGQGKTS